MYKYYLAYKPFDVLCQFTKEKDDDRTLQELKIVDKDVYSVGRLDKDSEGMLLLTNDNKLKMRLPMLKIRSIKVIIVK